MKRFDEREHPRGRGGLFTNKPGSVTDTAGIRDLADSLHEGPVDPDSGIPFSQQMPVFVYGTLRPGQGNYQHILKGNTVGERTGTLVGARMWTNGGFPYAAQPDDVTDDEIVTGTLIDVDEDLWGPVSSRLDSLEGFDPNARYNHYNRTCRTITLPDGTSQQAWVYLLGRGDDLDGQFPRVTGGDWEQVEEDWSRVPLEQRPWRARGAPPAPEPDGVDDVFNSDDSAAACVECGEPGDWLCKGCTAMFEQDPTVPEPCRECGGPSTGGGTWHTSDGTFRLCGNCAEDYRTAT